MKERKIVVAIEGYSDDPPFVFIAREGDEEGTRLVEGDAGFLEAVREMAATPGGWLARRYLEQRDKQA